jgi:3-dehydroquinate synthetase
MYFVTRDVNEDGLRMTLNFGHTFAHAIEVKNNYSKKYTHGEAVLTGMILAIKLSILKKNCKKETLNQVRNLYIENNLTYTLKNISSAKWIKSLIPFLKNDKKNDDEKINFLLLKKIGKTDLPNKFKISIPELKKYCGLISQY